MVNSCRECENCHAGEEQYCLKGNTGTYGAVDRDGTITQGGYSTHVVVTEDFVVTIPEGIPLDVAAPLLCAGITTYSPLRHWNAGPGKKVAVVGLGGLGHMAVKIAHAMGAEVTVLSQSLNKQEDGLRLGADHYYATSDANTFTELAGSFDLIINTVSASIDISAYLQLLPLDGTLVNVGAPAEPLPVHVFALFGGRRSFAGSGIGGIRETQEMLDFCAEHGIGAEIEVIPAEQDQRGLRARPRLGCPLPLRDRHRHPELARNCQWKSKPRSRASRVRGTCSPATSGLTSSRPRSPSRPACASTRCTLPRAPARPGTRTPSGRPCTSPKASAWSRPAAAK